MKGQSTWGVLLWSHAQAQGLIKTTNRKENQHMFKRCFNIGVLLAASVVLGATAMAQTSTSSPDSTSDCTVRTMNHYWLSGGQTNKEPSGVCVFSSNNNH